jgi:hypothetical protein
MITHADLVHLQKQRFVLLTKNQLPRRKVRDKSFKSRRENFSKPFARVDILANPKSLGEEENELAKVDVAEGKGKGIEQGEGEIDAGVAFANMGMIEKDQRNEIGHVRRFLEIEGSRQRRIAVFESEGRAGDDGNDRGGNQILDEIILVAFEIEFRLLEAIFLANDVAVDGDAERINNREDRGGKLLAEEKVGSPIGPSWPIPDFGANLVEIGENEIADWEDGQAVPKHPLERAAALGNGP